MDKGKESWEQAFWNTVDGHVPETPRHVQLARLSGVDPIVVDLGGLRYEQDQGEVLVNHFLTKRAYEGVQISGCPAHGGYTGSLVYQPELAAGDLVCVVQLEGKQQVVILCKVV